MRKHEKFLFVWEFVLGKFVSLVLLMEVYSSARFCEMTSYKVFRGFKLDGGTSEMNGVGT